MNNYPILKVTLLYGLIGGLIGGLLVGFILVIVFRIPSLGLIEWLRFLLLTSIFGSVIGFIPAILTGFAIAKLQIIENNFRIFLIGFVITFICCILVLLFKNFDKMTANLFISTIIAIIGGISASITGSFILPKQLKSE